MNPVKVTVYHLYAGGMNIYGDRGNVIALAQRARWRGLDVEVVAVGLGERPDLSRADVVFIGGGQDKEQVAVSRDLQGYVGKALIDAVEAGVAVLAICGGYQLLGHYFKTGSGEVLPGIGLLDAHTVAGKRRFIGDVIVECELATPQPSPGGSSPQPSPGWPSPQSSPAGRGSEKSVARGLVPSPAGRGGESRGAAVARGLVPRRPPAKDGPSAKGLLRSILASAGAQGPRLRTGPRADVSSTSSTRTLVGFENHSGLTYLGEGVKPLGRVLAGCGNNGRDGTEGAVHRNAVGCYLHGSLLPKNPWFADYLLLAGLRRRYGAEFELPPLDDSLEQQAHQAVIDRIHRRGRVSSAIQSR